MKLTNNQILGINNTLQALAEEKLTGAFKFKLYKITKKIGEEAQDIVSTLDFDHDGRALRNEANLEVLEISQDIDVDTLTEQELADLPLSVADLIALEPITEQEEKGADE
ncbi:hypothetical protein QP246_02540 [Aerococcus urinae]|uniref:hypothetical protein n=1 Tax=Aerococcus urinae TaxID=1376 RepID=UPI00254A91B6|nr:hypothetical protein [Aerococcus urinae]MDK6688336.1 hypothetical protein [Aerococcus urinae]